MQFKPRSGDLSILAQLTPRRGVRVKTDRAKVRALVGDALLAGRISSPWGETIDNAGDCMAPVSVELLGEATFDHPVEAQRQRRYGDMLVRCRKCLKCLEHRSTVWAARACAELAVAQRTWFGTLTLSPEAQECAYWEARKRYRTGGSKDFDALPEAEQFAARHRVINDDLTRYLKRVRKESAASLRYLLVVEAHKTGLPHYHMLLHERLGQVRKRTLDSQWISGFTRWRLVEPGVTPAFYVSKYLAKSALARVRASRLYGRDIKVGLDGPAGQDTRAQL